ncbi:MAG TPA: MBL fold metallo-hydrolase, partial [Candidatus Polarisedimenticolia bacterium]|nr:MBL fold metallo-hydrolase [Candidatus Polarisedimenticolia bacterium]
LPVRATTPTLTRLTQETLQRHPGRPCLLLLPAIVCLAAVPASAASKPTPVSTAPAAVLERAIAALGGEAALRLDQFSLVYQGQSFPSAVDQGFSPDRSVGVRLQESLVFEVRSHHAARRWESQNVDGSPTLWREGVVGDRGYRMNIKTQRRWPASTGLENTWDQLAWRVPQLALLALSKERASLRSEGSVTIDGLAFDALGFPLASADGRTVTVLFDRETGLPAGYQHAEERLLGRLMVRALFKPYRRYEAGTLPAGYTLSIGDQRYQDLDLLDARRTITEGDLWFELPADQPDRPPLVVQQPSTTTEVHPGVFLMRNVGGSNTLFVDLGDCVAVLDAIAQYRGATLLPPAGRTEDLAAKVLAQIKSSLDKPVCWVVPTHHHDDHFGGISRFAAAGATVLTTPGNLEFARRTLQANGAGDGRIEVVRDRRVLGSGPNAMEVGLLRGPHVEEMLFVHLPGHRLLFEGDLADYVLQATAFLRFLDEHPMPIDTILSVHGGRPYTMGEIRNLEPGN